MVVQNDKSRKSGYTSITEENGKHADMLLDFGLLNLKAGENWNCDEQKERAWLLIKGEAVLEWEGQSETVTRISCFDESPSVLHVPQGVPVTIKAVKDTEFAVEKKTNANTFDCKLYRPEDIRCDIFGEGILNDASKRTVRTVFDGEIAPYSNMVMGEVINHPGRWSSYPPHDHPQPEIYHYRHFPEQGFGVSLIGEDPEFVKNGDTTLVPPDKTHSQVAGAGYAMYYIWMIPHLENDRWLPTTRYFAKDHEWLKEPDVKIWPELKYGEEK